MVTQICFRGALVIYGLVQLDNRDHMYNDLFPYDHMDNLPKS